TCRPAASRASIPWRPSAPNSGAGGSSRPQRCRQAGDSADRILGVHAWSVGDHLTHRFNSELGTGCVTAIEGRSLVVHFPAGGTTLRLAANSDALVPGAERSRRRDLTLLERLAAGEIDE